MTYYYDSSVTLHHGDCLDVLRTLPDNSIDSIVTDPPYGLADLKPAAVAQVLAAWAGGDREAIPSGRGFMGKSWDAFVPPPAVWDEALRVLKPGGHLLAFAGSRTYDLMGLSIRLAGFEIRDSIAWMYGQGFPKSMDVAKAIASGTGRPEDIRRLSMGDTYEPSGRGRVNYDNGGGSQMNGSTAPVELPSNAAAWGGWGTALKPAFEPIVFARKPLEGTVAANVLAHGTGAINIDGSRIGTESTRRDNRAEMGYHGGNLADSYTTGSDSGRFPANVLLDEAAAEALDAQSGTGKSRKGKPRGAASGDGWGMTKTGSEYDDEGGASRFFYTAKASKAERPVVDGVAHPTVKPLSLMRYLVKLVTPPGGVVLDPFTGSGATIEAALLEDLQAVGIERERSYLPLIEARLERSSEDYKLLM